MIEATLRNAIWDWVNRATGFTGERLFWEGQRTPAENEAYITLRLGDILGDGMDEVVYSELATPTENTDIRATVQGPRELVLTIQAHNGGMVGASSNMQLLNKVISYLSLPSIQELIAGKFGVGPITPIRPVEASEGLYDARAFVDITIYVVSSFTEDLQSIQHVEITNEINNTAQVVPPLPEP